MVDYGYITELLQSYYSFVTIYSIQLFPYTIYCIFNSRISVTEILQYLNNYVILLLIS